VQSPTVKQAFAPMPGLRPDPEAITPIQSSPPLTQQSRSSQSIPVQLKRSAPSSAPFFKNGRPAVWREPKGRPLGRAGKTLEGEVLIGSSAKAQLLEQPHGKQPDLQFGQRPYPWGQEPALRHRNGSKGGGAGSRRWRLRPEDPRSSFRFLAGGWR